MHRSGTVYTLKMRCGTEGKDKLVPRLTDSTRKYAAKKGKGGFASDVASLLNGEAVGARFRCEVVGKPRPSLVKLEVRVTGWDGAVAAEHVAAFICGAIDWHDMKGTWPIDGKWPSAEKMFRATNAKEWTVAARTRDAHVCAYTYDGDSEGAYLGALIKKGLV